MTTSDAIQLVTAVAAVGAAVVALEISAKDRRNAIEVSRADRQEATKRQVLLLRLEAAIRLEENAARGGSTDPAESSRMGAEALSLVAALGPKYVPDQWQRRIGVAGDLEEALTDATLPEMVKMQIEAGLAIDKIEAELRLLEGD
ncbi:MAG: hypothetical protein CVT68_03950 [Actinobacteria bacterium HGW-Actinobacteria-8]|nr:MAG: hypothetical protein CVT68_03950 [Actinobacteria bacterium HGW-Actinobacteria-8]